MALKKRPKASAGKKPRERRAHAGGRKKPRAWRELRIRVVGAGIRGIAQLTLEALAALRQAPKVLVLGVDADALASVGLPDAESLSSLYREGARDEDNYQRIRRRVYAAARQYGEVALLVSGHPRVGVTFLQWLEQDRKTRPFALEVIEGISSFDTMINDLRRDPLERGSVLLDANRVLLFRLALEPRVDHYIYHVCSVGTARTYMSEPATANAIHLLKEHLLRYYPPEHPVELLSSANTASGELVRVVGRVETLEALLPAVTFSSSLFIPAMQPKTVDGRFLELLGLG
jgi:uncharacterized protein YabN with tetrapyrrole methylase and pyrophosphatase domain